MWSRCPLIPPPEGTMDFALLAAAVGGIGATPPPPSAPARTGTGRTGWIALGLVLLVPRALDRTPKPKFNALGEVPWWGWLGGACAAVYVTATVRGRTRERNRVTDLTPSPRTGTERTIPSSNPTTRKPSRTSFANRRPCSPRQSLATRRSTPPPPQPQRLRALPRRPPPTRSPRRRRSPSRPWHRGSRGRRGVWPRGRRLGRG